MLAQSPYPYQEKVQRLLHQGQSVLLHAPTGCGKTRAAVEPFLEAQASLPPDAFPRQCLYTVPMRVLATQFEEEYRQGVAALGSRLPRQLGVTIQTGERSEDPKLMGDLVFATLDQVLSSALGVPYSLSRGQSNINVGAVWGSYLVFDEFHLFPVEARDTTLQLLRVFGKYVPFMLMTATFSKAILDEVAHMLGAETVVLDEDEVEAIETRGGRTRKERRLAVVPRVLEADDVLASHHRRSLAVCNTVDRATALFQSLTSPHYGCVPVPFAAPEMTPLYERLRQARGPQEHAEALGAAVSFVRDRHLAEDDGSIKVMLLHSRFGQAHRQVKEALLRELWGPDDATRRSSPSLIVVSTQVVEVGLDISSEALHTEAAPAASVLQRSGRCARYPGEVGTVNVYAVPADSKGEPNYAPYDTSNAEQCVCALSWEALRSHDGQVLRFSDERDVINAAHEDADRVSLERMRKAEGQTWARITDAAALQDVRVRRDLIRHLDSRTIWIRDVGEGPTDESPFAYEAFSLHHGTLRGKLAALQELAGQIGAPWAVRYLVIEKDNEEQATREGVYRWLTVDTQEDLSSSLLFAINPSLVAYDAECGLRLCVTGDGMYQSPLAVGRQRDEYSGYGLESYLEHVTAMAHVFRRFEPRLEYLEERLRVVTDGLFDRDSLRQAVRLAIAVHDAGKLTEQWQGWAAAYEKAIGEGEPPYLAAHTHYDKHNDAHAAAERSVHPRRPPHAGEGAHASISALCGVLGRRVPALIRATATAVARHHDAGLSNARPYRMHARASDVIGEALAAVGIAGTGSLLITKSDGPDLSRWLLPPWPDCDWQDWLIYFAIVRYLRLCDGLSQEEDV